VTGSGPHEGRGAEESAPAGAPDLDAEFQAGGYRQLVAARIRRLEQVREIGMEPYPTHADRTHDTASVIAAFVAHESAAGADATNGGSAVDGAERDKLEATVAGRLVGAVRNLGGSAFVHLRDGSGELQLHLRADALGEGRLEQFLELFDPGDFVSAGGTVFRTRRGEVTLAVERFSMLAKSLRPLPDKWHGVQDIETRLRRRYLDLLANVEVRQRFEKRTAIVREMRRFLDDQGFLEVETPVLQPIYGGGSARPFETHYHALDRRMYLRIADELYLKRLLVGGFERVYEISKDFRNEGIDRTHMPEFTMMECYQAFADYATMMVLTENMVAKIATAVNGSTRIEVEGREIDLAPPWRRLTVRQAVRDATGVDIAEHSTLEALRSALEDLGVDIKPQPTWARTVDALIGERVEPGIAAPTFLMDHPVELSPLAKRRPDDPRWAERFEPLVAGFELGNAFSELNDPFEQRLRFEEMAEQRLAGDGEAHPLDEDFVEALMHGMPPAGGLGLGVDRLVMLLTGAPSIRETVLFPQLRT